MAFFEAVKLAKNIMNYECTFNKETNTQVPSLHKQIVLELLQIYVTKQSIIQDFLISHEVFLIHNNQRVVYHSIQYT